MTITTLKLEGRLDATAAAKLETGFVTKAGALAEKADKADIIDQHRSLLHVAASLRTAVEN